MDKKIYSLQALRAVGALLVVIFHAEHLGAGINLHVGASGVDLFFIISGIVMFLSTPSGTSISYFAWRRFIRVAPLYWILTSAAIAYFTVTTDSTPSLQSMLSSFFFLPTPEAGSFPILYPGWSLNYEIFFYLLICLSLLGGRFAFLVTVLLVTSLGALWKTIDIPYLQYYCVPGMLEFGIGVVIGILIKKGLHLNRTTSIILIVVGLSALSLSTNGQKVNPAAALGIPWAMILIGSMNFEHSKFVRSKITQMLGEASYSIYLAHPFVIWFFQSVFPTDKNLHIFIATVVLSLTAGVAIHILIEKPITSRLGKVFVKGRVLPPQPAS